jgi:hypothetical protein
MDNSRAAIAARDSNLKFTLNTPPLFVSDAGNQNPTNCPHHRSNAGWQGLAWKIGGNICRREDIGPSREPIIV